MQYATPQMTKIILYVALPILGQHSSLNIRACTANQWVKEFSDECLVTTGKGTANCTSQGVEEAIK